MAKIIFSLIALASLNAYAFDEPQYMKDLVTKALSKHPALSSIAKVSSAAREMTGVSNYVADPMVQTNHFLSPLETRNGPQRYNIMVSQPIPWPGTISAQQAQARVKGELADQNLEAKKLDVAFAVRSAVLDLITVKSMKSVEVDLQNSLTSFREVVLSRIQVGKATQSDVAKLDVEIASVKQKILELNLQIKLATHQLAELTGEDVDLSNIPDAFPVSYLSHSKFSSLEQTLIAHPQYQAAVASVKYQEAIRAEERSKYFPKLSANVSWFGIDQPENSGVTDNPGKDGLSIGLAITIPIWSGWAGRVDREEHLIQSKQMDSQAIALTLKRQAEDVLAQLKMGQETLTIYQDDMIPNLKKALSIDQSSYSQGKVPIDRVLDDYTKLLGFELRLARTKQMIVTANAKLLSLGLGSGGTL